MFDDFQVNSQCVQYKPGQVVTGKIKYAHYNGIGLEVNGCAERIRSFTWVKIGGKLLVSEYGLKDAIEVSMLSEQEVENPRAVVPESDLGTEPRTAETVKAKNMGANPELEATPVEVSDWRIEKTMKASSIRRRMVGMLRSRNFEEYCELADMYTECDYEKEVYKESRHSGLSFRTMRRKRQQKLRTQRKLAAQHRVGLPFRFAGKVATATRINAILRKCA